MSAIVFGKSRVPGALPCAVARVMDSPVRCVCVIIRLAAHFSVNLSY
jgi:hypothetical protein